METRQTPSETGQAYQLETPPVVALPHVETTTMQRYYEESNLKKQTKRVYPRPKTHLPIKQHSRSSLQPLWAATLISVIASLCILLIVVAAKFIRDFALPHYVSAISSFVFGLAAVLVFQAVAGYFNQSEE